MLAAPTREQVVVRYLMLLGLAHGMIDMTSGAVVALLPTLREQFSLSYTMIGNIILFSNLTSSLTQPLFGILSDRADRRWLLPVSLMLGGVGLAAVGWTANYGLMLVAVVISSLGVAAFHPEGANSAGFLARGRRARAMSIYSVGGNMGYALAPLYTTGLLIAGAGNHGTIWAVVLPGLTAWWIWRLLPRWQALETDVAAHRAEHRENLPPTNWKGTVLITLLVIVRSMINSGVITYIPFFWIDVLGHDAKSAPYVQVMYLVAGAAGTLFGAPLADSIGTKRMLLASFAVLVPIQVALPFTHGWVLLVCLFLAGFVVVSTLTTTLVTTQEYMPRNPGLASGVNLGLGFGMGGLGTLLLGMVADRWGVVTVLHVVGALTPLAVALAATLPEPPGGSAPRTSVESGEPQHAETAQ